VSCVDPCNFDVAQKSALQKMQRRGQRRKLQLWEPRSQSRHALQVCLCVECVCFQECLCLYMDFDVCM